MTAQIKTGCWFTPLPSDHIQIGISRGTPREYVAKSRKFGVLSPGAWFNKVGPAEYIDLFNVILDKLDPAETAEQIHALSRGKTPVLCCWESVADINAGKRWCHRHLVALWLESNLGFSVPELDAPRLDRFAKLKLLGVGLPTYKIRQAA